MKPIIEWEYFHHFRNNVNLYGNFYVDLRRDKANFKIDNPEIKKICDDVLNPLCEFADYVYLYGNFTKDDLDIQPNLNYHKKRSKIQILDKNLSSYTELLKSNKPDNSRGSLIFNLRMDKGFLSKVFSNCYDPIVMSGMGSVCTKAAIGYAKSKMTDTTFFALLSEANTGFESLFFIANEVSFKHLTELAGRHCKARQWFITNYGPDVELAPLENKAHYGTGFPE